MSDFNRVIQRRRIGINMEEAERYVDYLRDAARSHLRGQCEENCIYCEKLATSSLSSDSSAARLEGLGC